MNEAERELREALALIDGIPVAGRENRARMVKAETKILAVANALKILDEKAKGAQNRDEAGSEEKHV